MVQFNELRITPDGKILIIDVSVKNLSYFTDVYLDSISIDTQDTFINSGVSSTPVYTRTVEGSLKTIRLELDASNILPSLLNSLFFIYVKVKGTPSSDTPCTMDNITTIGTVYNLYPIYQQALTYIGEVTNSCSTPVNFVNSILKYEALTLALKTAHFDTAISYWTRYFMNSSPDVIVSQDCNCNG